MDNSNEPNDQSSPDNFALVKVTRGLVFATFALALVSFLVGFLQWYTLKGQLAEMHVSSEQNKELIAATRDANETNREALHSIQRAFVSVNSLTPPAALTRNSKMYFVTTIVWENSGNTPTRNLEIQTACFVGDAGLSNQFDWISVCRNKEESFCATATSFIGPHETIGGGACWIPQDTILNLQRSSRHLYILSISRYQDIFANTKSHITRSCQEIQTIRGNPFGRSLEKNPISYDFSHCHGHNNCADEECDIR
jgi:hypothetical protein